MDELRRIEMRARALRALFLALTTGDEDQVRGRQKQIIAFLLQDNDHALAKDLQAIMALHRSKQ